jgi:hypothetical protein
MVSHFFIIPPIYKRPVNQKIEFMVRLRFLGCLSEVILAAILGRCRGSGAAI